MAPPGIPTVSMVRTTIPSTGTTSSTPFHFSFSFLFWLILDAWGEPGRLWILAFIARSDAPSHARNATPLHSSRLEAREHSRREGGDPILSRAELPRRPRRTCRLQPLAQLISCAPVPVAVDSTPPLTWRERRAAGEGE